jgi:hypothetical protein
LLGFGAGSGLVFGINFFSAKSYQLWDSARKGWQQGRLLLRNMLSLDLWQQDLNLLFFKKWELWGIRFFGTAVWTVAIGVGLTVSGIILYNKYQPKQILNEKINMSA